jgi:hypothetical protein
VLIGSSRATPILVLLNLSPLEISWIFNRAANRAMSRVLLGALCGMIAVWVRWAEGEADRLFFSVHLKQRAKARSLRPFTHFLAPILRFAARIFGPGLWPWPSPSGPLGWQRSPALKGGS